MKKLEKIKNIKLMLFLEITQLMLKLEKKKNPLVQVVVLEVEVMTLNLKKMQMPYLEKMKLLEKKK